MSLEIVSIVKPLLWDSTAFKGHTKNVYIILYLLPPLKGLFFWIPKPRLNFHLGNTLTLKEWLTAKRVDNFKYTLITMMPAFTKLSIKKNG